MPVTGANLAGQVSNGRDSARTGGERAGAAWWWPIWTMLDAKQTGG